MKLEMVIESLILYFPLLFIWNSQCIKAGGTRKGEKKEGVLNFVVWFAILGGQVK